MHDAERLRELTALPLERKIQITQTRIIEWYQHYNGGVCVSFSGGKDSSVLLHIARQIYPNIPAVFSNTGLKYYSIQKAVSEWDNVDIIRPKMRFDEVISTYGYPLIGKEVAEAIYYARRIRTDSAERERRRRRELHGMLQRENNGNCSATERLEKVGTGGGKNQLIKTSTARNRRTVLSGRMPGTGVVQTGQTGEGGVFSHPEEQFGQKSQFNKEKWLPMVYTPFLISHLCCSKMKKSPMHKYQSQHKRKPIIATLAEESRIRKQAWIMHGCNAFESKNPMSQPMSFRTKQDVLSYIVKYDVPLASVYGDIVSIGQDGNEYPPIDLMGKVQCNLKCTGCQRTGCVYCGFGFHTEKGKTRFQILAEIEPKKYEYSIKGGAMGR